MKNIAVFLGIAALLVACARQEDVGGTDQVQTEQGTERTAPTTTEPQVTVPAQPAEPGQTTGANDQQITDAVRNAIAAEPGTPTAQQVQVNVQNGVVTLRGNVSTMEEKQELEQQVRDIPGVVRVENQLQVAQGQAQPQGQGQGQQPAPQQQPQ